MKKTLYLMRHGQTLFNVEHKIQGWCDSPLTEQGIKQAEIAARYFDDNKITFDHCYASTSERACDTLEIVTHHKYPYTLMVMVTSLCNMVVKASNRYKIE